MSEVTLEQALRQGIKQLLGQVDTPQLDASVLLQHATGFSQLDLIVKSSDTITPETVILFNEFIQRRLNHEPVAYITGTREFWGLEFDVRPGVLIPRPDTETIIGTLLALLPETDIPLKIADLGVGSGAIIVSLLSEYTSAVGYGVDAHETPLEVTKQNAIRHGVMDRLELLHGNWADQLPEAVNVIVSNPPYIRPKDYAELSADVKGFEPETALIAQDDGLAAYRALIPSAHSKLQAGGLLVLEIGFDQRQDVLNLLTDDVWQDAMSFKDLAGRDRVIVAIKK